jgi:hypothetical protein
MIQTLKAWEGSGLKMVVLDAIPICKGVVALLLGPVEDTKCYFRDPVGGIEDLILATGESVSTRGNQMGSTLCSVLILRLSWQ